MHLIAWLLPDEARLDALCLDFEGLFCSRSFQLQRTPILSTSEETALFHSNSSVDRAAVQFQCIKIVSYIQATMVDNTMASISTNPTIVISTSIAKKYQGSEILT